MAIRLWDYLSVTSRGGSGDGDRNARKSGRFGPQIGKVSPAGIKKAVDLSTSRTTDSNSSIAHFLNQFFACPGAFLLPISAKYRSIQNSPHSFSNFWDRILTQDVFPLHTYELLPILEQQVHDAMMETSRLQIRVDGGWDNETTRRSHVINAISTQESRV
uniref:Uncharacterized protein n=1 Tax=Mesocestoides corti TaxID=53468 RepID=A0A5K3EHY0_MESCO